MRTMTLVLALLWLTATTQAADLGRRVSMDLRLSTPAQVQAADGMEAGLAQGTLSIQVRDASYGWVTCMAAVPVVEGMTLTLAADALTGGKLSAQAEWFDAAGKFLTHSDLLALTEPTAEARTVNLSPPGTAAVQVRLKLWLEGKGAAARLTQFTLSSPRAFRQTKLQLVDAWRGSDELAPSDDGKLVGSAVGPDLCLTLTPDTPYAGLALSKRLALTNADVLLLDVLEIHDGVITLQMLCFDENGKYLAAVDLLKDIDRPLLAEVRWDLFREMIPAATRQVSAKFWLVGKSTTARVGGVFVGRQP